MPGPKYTQAQQDRAAEMREAGATYTRIEKVTGIKATSAHWICLKLGAHPPHARPARTRGPMVTTRGGHVLRRFTPEEDALIQKERTRGASVSEIARQIGRKPNSVRGRLMTLARHDALKEGA